jgi:hypothetical protein
MAKTGCDIHFAPEDCFELQEIEFFSSKEAVLGAKAAIEEELAGQNQISI